MECKRAAQLISNGVLDSAGTDLAELREHAAHCEVCLVELRAYEIMISHVSDLEQHTVPSSLRANIMSAVAPDQVPCSAVLPLLSAAADKELNWSDSSIVNNHVTNCPHCASELAKIQMFTNSVSDLGYEVPPSRVRTRIYSDIHKIENAGSNFGWLRSNRNSWRLGTAIASMVCCIAIYFNIFINHQPAVSTYNDMRNAKVLAPPSVGHIAKIPQEKAEIKKLVAEVDMDSQNFITHDSVKIPHHTLSLKDYASTRSSNNQRSLDSTKAVNALLKKNKANKQTIDTKNFSVIPDARDIKYNLEEHGPINLPSEPEVVASAAGSNVISEYAGDEQYFTEVAEKVQNKNRLDTWLEKSKSLTGEAKLSSKKANVQLLGFRF